MKHNSLAMSVDDQNTQMITLATNDELLKMLNPEELKIQWSSETHLPVLAELVQYFGSQKVLDWMGDGSKPSNEKLVHEASNYVLPTTCGDGKMHFKAAVDYLKRKYKKVNDVRSDVEMYLKMPKPDTVEPTKEDGWTFLSKTVGFRQALQGYFPRRNPYKEKSGDVQMHSTVIVTGQMGVGKTEELLRFVKARLKDGSTRSVLYLGPRILLVDQAVLRFRGIKLDRKISRRQRIYTTVYHSSVEGGSQTLDEQGEVVKDGKKLERR